MFFRRKRHADAVSPLSIAMAQAISLDPPPMKTPTERHADSLAAVLQNLRDKRTEERMDSDMYRDLAAECDARAAELDAIMAAIEPAHEKLTAARLPRTDALEFAPDAITAQLA